jgi:hypothetical protein
MSISKESLKEILQSFDYHAMTVAMIPLAAPTARRMWDERPRYNGLGYENMHKSMGALAGIVAGAAIAVVASASCISEAENGDWSYIAVVPVVQTASFFHEYFRNRNEKKVDSANKV